MNTPREHVHCPPAGVSGARTDRGTHALVLASAVLVAACHREPPPSARRPDPGARPAVVLAPAIIDAGTIGLDAPIARALVPSMPSGDDASLDASVDAGPRTYRLGRASRPYHLTNVMVADSPDSFRVGLFPRDDGLHAVFASEFGISYGRLSATGHIIGSLKSTEELAGRDFGLDGGTLNARGAAWASYGRHSIVWIFADTTDDHVVFEIGGVDDMVSPHGEYASMGEAVRISPTHGAVFLRTTEPDFQVLEPYNSPTNYSAYSLHLRESGCGMPLGLGPDRYLFACRTPANGAVTTLDEVTPHPGSQGPGDINFRLPAPPGIDPHGGCVFTTEVWVCRAASPSAIVTVPRPQASPTPISMSESVPAATIVAEGPPGYVLLLLQGDRTSELTLIHAADLVHAGSVSVPWRVLSTAWVGDGIVLAGVEIPAPDVDAEYSTPHPVTARVTLTR